MFTKFTNVTFRYPRRAPLFQGLDLEIETFPTVLLGPNGAGKSTLMGLLSGALKPKLGTVDIAVDTQSASRRGARRSLASRVGWLPQDVKPIAGLRVREQVAYAGWLKGMTSKAAFDKAGSALERVGLTAEAAQGAGSLSGGQRRRMGIAQAIVNEPDFVILDEPYAGLDPEQRSSIREVILSLSTTVNFFVSTHQTDDLEDIYTSVVVLDHGKICFNGPTHEFLALASPEAPSSMRAEQAYTELLRSARREP